MPLLYVPPKDCLECTSNDHTPRLLPSRKILANQTLRATSKRKRSATSQLTIVFDVSHQQANEQIIQLFKSVGYIRVLLNCNQ
mmetsp:Transcript_21858/g.37180  ORF Transcript_21858/g.37180 Transcript_21858/m.37180 type:complete len:83 (+) Transcript_21858:238-486(+)